MTTKLMILWHEDDHDAMNTRAGGGAWSWHDGGRVLRSRVHAKNGTTTYRAFAP